MVPTCDYCINAVTLQAESKDGELMYYCPKCDTYNTKEEAKRSGTNSTPA